jgi:flotillin
MGPTIILFVAFAGLLLLMLMFFISRYRRCPSDKILVIYGRTGSGSARCLAGGAAFVWPVIQDYEYLDLTPMSIDVDLRGALSRQNIRVNVPSRFTVAVSNEEGVMINAAERLLGKTLDEIRDISKDIIFGQLRLVVATMDIEEINSDRDKFLTYVSQNVGAELRKIGLQLINVNVTDIHDESGYIQALGKEAAAKAINEAKMIVAQKNRDGSIGEAEAVMDQRIKVSNAEAEASSGEADAARLKRVRVAEAEADAKIGEANAMQEQRIKTAEANAIAVEGENLSQVRVAQSEAERRIKQAEALRLATAAEKIQTAHALQEAYLAEKTAEEARAQREMATRQADVIVHAEITKQKVEIDAEAEAEQIRRRARGEADAIFMKREAEARGLFEILQKQADGFQKIVDAAGGNPRDAVLMLIADKLPELVRTQVDAIKNIKIDKVTVWEGGQGKEGESNSTAKFISGLYRAVPPMNDLFNMAGMDLPKYLGEKKESEPASEEAKTEGEGTEKK